MCVCKGGGGGGGGGGGDEGESEVGGGEQGTISSSYCASLAVGVGGGEWGLLAWCLGFYISHNTFYFK